MEQKFLKVLSGLWFNLKKSISSPRDILKHTYLMKWKVWFM